MSTDFVHPKAGATGAASANRRLRSAFQRVFRRVSISKVFETLVPAADRLLGKVPGVSITSLLVGKVRCKMFRYLPAQ